MPTPPKPAVPNLAALRRQTPAKPVLQPPTDTNKLEAETAAEFVELQTAFQARAKREQARQELATDSEYWTAIVFQSREQKEAFLAALGLLEHGDKYLDGYEVAKAMNITLPPAEVPYSLGRIDKRLAALVRK
jgi:hypothetical protein